MLNRSRPTVADIRANKGKRQMTMVHIENREEARACAAAGVDVLSIETPIWDAGMREAAGLSIKEVGEAINLSDPTLLDLVENGKVALPFEVVLRLASVLGRNDPISFVMRFTRSYNPEVWKTLEGLGIGRFAEGLGRRVKRDDALREIARAFLTGAGMTVPGELARVTGLSRPDAGRGNRALVAEGYATSSATGVYQLARPPVQQLHPA